MYNWKLCLIQAIFKSFSWSGTLICNGMGFMTFLWLDDMCMLELSKLFMPLLLKHKTAHSLKNSCCYHKVFFLLGIGFLGKRGVWPNTVQVTALHSCGDAGHRPSIWGHPCLREPGLLEPYPVQPILTSVLEMSAGGSRYRHGLGDLTELAYLEKWKDAGTAGIQSTKHQLQGQMWELWSPSKRPHWGDTAVDNVLREWRFPQTFWLSCLSLPSRLHPQY